MRKSIHGHSCSVPVVDRAVVIRICIVVFVSLGMLVLCVVVIPWLERDAHDIRRRNTLINASADLYEIGLLCAAFVENHDGQYPQSLLDVASNADSLTVFTLPENDRGIGAIEDVAKWSDYVWCLDSLYPMSNTIVVMFFSREYGIPVRVVLLGSGHIKTGCSKDQ